MFKNKKMVQVVKPTGTGGGVEIPKVSNLTISNGIASWTAPDLTDLVDYNPSVSYLVYVNNTLAYETTTTSQNIIAWLNNGFNTISVVVKVILTNIEDTKTTIVYSESYSITTLATTLPIILHSACSVIIGTNVYIFGGYGVNNNITSGVRKFDTTSETTTILNMLFENGISYNCSVAIGTNAYIFGGYIGNGGTNKIYRFDTINEIITTLSTTLPQALYNACLETIGTNAYIFGGRVGSTGTNAICKFTKGI